MQCVSKKRGHGLMTIILSNLNRFFTGRFLSKFAVKMDIKNGTASIAYVATLPCVTLMPANKLLTTNYKVKSVNI